MAPFQFIGTFSGGLSNVDLVGAGTVTSTFQRVTEVCDFDFYVQQRSVYNFGSPGAVPEPGTMLLVASGIVWGFRRHCGGAGTPTAFGRACAWLSGFADPQRIGDQQRRCLPECCAIRRRILTD